MKHTNDIQVFEATDLYYLLQNTATYEKINSLITLIISGLCPFKFHMRVHIDPKNVVINNKFELKFFFQTGKACVQDMSSIYKMEIYSLPEVARSMVSLCVSRNIKCFDHEKILKEIRDYEAAIEVLLNPTIL